MFKDGYEKYKIIQPYLEDDISLTHISISKNIPIRTLHL
jgi:hypothetical protein